MRAFEIVGWTEGVVLRQACWDGSVDGNVGWVFRDRKWVWSDGSGLVDFEALGYLFTSEDWEPIGYEGRGIKDEG